MDAEHLPPIPSEIMSAITNEMLRLTHLGEDPGPSIAVTEETADEIRALSEGAYERHDLDEVFRLTGVLISTTASLEHFAAALAAYWLNPAAPERAVHAVRNLSARSVQMVLEDILPATGTEGGAAREWVDGKKLLSELREASEFRNKLAHGVWVDLDITADGQIDRTVYVQVVDRKTGRDSRVSIGLDSLRLRLDRSRSLTDAMMIACLWSARFGCAIPFDASIPGLARLLEGNTRPEELEAIFGKDFDLRHQWELIVGSTEEEPQDDSGHVFRLRELEAGHPETRVIECVGCKWQSDPMLPLEDQTVPVCPVPY